MANVSINQMRTVLEAGEAVPLILNKALPKLEALTTKLDEFAAFVQPQRVEKAVLQPNGTYKYVASAADQVMDMPWSDAVAARHQVRQAISGVEDILSKAKGGSISNGQAGPPSLAVRNATEALTELRLAKTELGSSLHVWVGDFGGAHAQLVPQRVDATATHLGRAENLIKAALRNHVNG